jgi:uncharacterized protein (DUF305 family)
MVTAYVVGVSEARHSGNGSVESVLADDVESEVAAAKVVDEMKSYGTALLVLFAFVFSACGSSAQQPQPALPTDQQPAITGQPAGFNADDVVFATNAVASYGQTAALADLVPAHSSDPNVIALASAIGAASAPKLEMMKVFLVQWNSDSDTSRGQDRSAGATPGMVDDATMTQLQSLRGKDFDTLWLRSMIGHLQGVVTFAQTEIAKGVNVDALDTAKQVVDAERAHVAQMQQMLGAG